MSPKKVLGVWPRTTEWIGRIAVRMRSVDISAAETEAPTTTTR